MTGPLTRIALRYGAGALAAWGLLAPGTGDQLAADQDVVAVAQVALAAIAAVVAEGAYWAAKKMGWRT